MELFPIITLPLIFIKRGLASLKCLLPGLYLSALLLCLDIYKAMDLSDRFNISGSGAAILGSWTLPAYWLILLTITVLQVYIYVKNRNVNSK